MHTELKKQIVIYLLDNMNNFQIINATKKEFRQYIYIEEGSYCIGGEEVENFIKNIYKTLKS